jgi:hypothetical protein
LFDLGHLQAGDDFKSLADKMVDKTMMHIVACLLVVVATVLQALYHALAKSQGLRGF